jgi:hypothetical protein
LVFDSSLRAPLVYEIAVRYQTPMWRAGAMLRAACMAGFWLLLLWFPPGTWPQGAAMLALGTIGAVTAWAHNRSWVLDFLVARDVPGLSAAARHLIGAKQRATADLSGLLEGFGIISVALLYAGPVEVRPLPALVYALGTVLIVIHVWSAFLQAMTDSSWYSPDSPPGRAVLVLRPVMPLIVAIILFAILGYPVYWQPTAVSTGYLPVLGAALRHGPWIAGLCAFAVTPGALIVIARVLERRWLVPREQFAAVTYGDPLLAVAAGLAVWLTGARTPHGLTGPAAGVVVVAVMLLFGLAQWRDELRRGYYTRAQAVAPTKIWHQLVVYPVLGYWLWTAGIGGLSAPGGAAVWAGKTVLLALVVVWAAANVYDRRHPKLGHPPFDWRRVRPCPRPWAAESQTLLAAGPG